MFLKIFSSFSFFSCSSFLFFYFFYFCIHRFQIKRKRKENTKIDKFYFQFYRNFREKKITGTKNPMKQKFNVSNMRFCFFQQNFFSWQRTSIDTIVGLRKKKFCLQFQNQKLKCVFRLTKQTKNSFYFIYIFRVL